ncbi:MAG: glycosyltransferase family 2 protein [Candidatus Omnitrophica bacterium]|nr:glycosyltransferase family 2 protein [Candidatus Omnitrophota bacterium]MBU4467245.1 glycosyltransferase family 2 protein [Candidatus Omnitrophota bacterium]MCG2707105.1 glycosyltransferase family 2 protein [Candidatus Omnitrophota bacterium]
MIKKISEISITVPILDEEENIKEFYLRLKEVLDKLDKNYEMIFIDDGSKDSSFEILKELSRKDNRVKVVRFEKNFGQSAAFLAGFHYARGNFIVTMDADLQCDPAEVNKLVEKIDFGFDAVGAYRKNRCDSRFIRKIPSFFMNKIMNNRTGIKLKDWGCSFSALSREIAVKISFYGDNARFIKPLAAKLATNSTEIEIKHCERKHGKSRYNLFKLFVNAFDFLINSSAEPSKSNRPLFVVQETLGL